MSLEWYPIVNYELCTGCAICFDFCPHGVYEWNDEEGPVVVKPDNCIQGCHGCENQCPSQALCYYGDLPGKKIGGAYRIPHNAGKWHPALGRVHICRFNY